MNAYFPLTYKFWDKPSDGIGGPPVDDDGAIYVARDEGNFDDLVAMEEGKPLLVLKTSLTELVDDLLDGWAGHDGLTCEDHIPASDALAAALRAAADKLDAAKGQAQP
jgi:hypothetical protein